uniref:Uncharacterized protein n=1 Tax=Entomoneis paludosa TaxID=265537 RepID=A0A7S2YTS4_9STRA|mmetsp:Transcript_9768/g.20221  ORF Transcript_9768/g.20221 Transcript_9768/m.20221 type:complete len:162 (+) Transcript_9768:1-486(+)
MALAQALANHNVPPFEFMVRTNEATYLNATKLRNMLPSTSTSTQEVSDFAYSGVDCRNDSPIVRDRRSPYYLSHELIAANQTLYKPHVRKENFYILSHPAVQCLAGPATTGLLPFENTNVGHHLAACNMTCRSNSQYQSSFQEIGWNLKRIRSLYQSGGEP